MKRFHLMLLLAFAVTSAVAAQKGNFSISFSESEPNQIVSATGGLMVSEVIVERADGTIEPVTFGSDSDEGDAYIASEDNWLAASAGDAKRFTFIVEATGPYEVLEINGLAFTIARPAGSTDSHWAVEVGDFSAEGALTLGEPLNRSRSVDQGAPARSVAVRIKGYDEQFDGGEFRLRDIQGSVAISRIGVQSDSTVDDRAPYAYAANADWLNLRPDAEHGLVVGEYFLSGYAWGATIGWIHFGNGAPANGWRYANDSRDDFGVNVDGLGNLSGFAYSAATGWINFGWADPGEAERPRIDLSDGGFRGYAYSANLGWIHLGDGDLLKTENMAPLDSQGDGLPDAWKYRYFGDLEGVDASSDFTGDGNLDSEHYLAGTDPTSNAAPLRLIDHLIEQNDDESIASLTFTSSPRRLYSIEYSDDLETWETAGPLQQPSAGASTTLELVEPTPAEKLFYRIRAHRPLSP